MSPQGRLEPRAFPGAMPRSRGPGLRAVPGAGCRRHLLAVARALPRPVAVRPALGDLARGIAAAESSEAHTSELQSLLRTSSAVFCLTTTPSPRTLYITTTHLSLPS